MINFRVKQHNLKIKLLTNFVNSINKWKENQRIPEIKIVPYHKN